MAILIPKCIYLTFDLAVTLIRSFRRDIYHVHFVISQIREYFKHGCIAFTKIPSNHFLWALEIKGSRLVALQIFTIEQNLTFKAVESYTKMSCSSAATKFKF